MLSRREQMFFFFFFPDLSIMFTNWLLEGRVTGEQTYPAHPAYWYTTGSAKSGQGHLAVLGPRVFDLHFQHRTSRPWRVHITWQTWNVTFFIACLISLITLRQQAKLSVPHHVWCPDAKTPLFSMDLLSVFRELHVDPSETSADAINTAFAATHGNVSKE